MDILAHARRRAFSLWLRTGRLPEWARPGRPERKFNPWHDPDDGRFTFTGRGRYFGRGSSGDRSVVRMHERVRDDDNGFNGGGASGSWETDEGARPKRDERPRAPPSGASSPQGVLDAYARRYRQSVDNPRNWRRVEANGYTYHLDSEGRTRRVSGRLTENPAHRRSRSAQANAGRPDRRRSDDGGHYIARRFNGPTEAFNHFAQDANFNRGLYRALEVEWSREIRAGRRVDVSIVPMYEGSSRRPSMINVSFWIDGKRKSLRFPNERRERSSAKR